MNIEQIGPEKWRLDVRCQFDGRQYRTRKTIEGPRSSAERKYWAIYEKLQARVKKARSLTSAELRTFGSVLRYYHDRKGYGTMWSTFRKMEKALGEVRNEEIADRFDTYLGTLAREVCPTTGRVRKPSTLNRYTACAKRAYAFALKRGKVEKNPLLAFEMEPEEARDRVLSADEEKRLLATLQRLDSYLYWPVVFSLRNPIRIGDLRALTWKNLDETRPWVHFYPQKTRRKRKRETCLPFLDEELLEWWAEIRELHPENEYLFPNIRTRAVRERGKVVGREVISVEPIGCHKKHWATVLAEAQIEDFHWHDLKHCSITWMLDNGYNERDLKNLGIQYTDSMIDRYYKADAGKVMQKWKRMQKSNDEAVHLAVHPPIRESKNAVSA